MSVKKSNVHASRFKEWSILKSLLTVSKRMFCLRRRNEENGKFDNQCEQDDDFGWWLNERRGTIESFSGRRECRSSGSSASMQSCIDFDDPESYCFAEDSTRRETSVDRGKAELRCSTPDKKLDVNLIERDATEADTKQRGTFTLTIMRTDCNGCSTDGKELDGSRRSESMSYTPERLVKSQEYRILTPEPRCMCISIARTPEVIERPQNQENLCLRDENSEDKNAIPKGQTAGEKYKDNRDRIKENQQETLSEIEELNRTWPNVGPMDFTGNVKGQERTIRRRLTLENTSGFRRKDWSSVARRDAPTDSNHLCLCEELSLAIENDRNHPTNLRDNRPISFPNYEIDSIDLTSEEDRFCQVSSAHDPLTRLALAIEMDGSVPDFATNPGNVVHQLRSKVDELRGNSGHLYDDLVSLRAKFRNDEARIDHLNSDITKLRQDIHEVRYLDDLLKLLEGEVDRISQRNWPFLIGRNDVQSEELNLVI